MIQEAYCSFEVAKRLKENGFDEPCHYFYKFDSRDIYYGSELTNLQIGDKFYNAPTHQMAMAWLREVHKIYIDISPTYSTDGIIHFIWQTLDSNYLITGDCDRFYPSYEEDVEEALKYVLENLI